MTTEIRDLRADCGRCCGLCCTGPAFDATQGFGYDKKPHSPCVHLDVLDRCSIHSDRNTYGFSACSGFDCFGAGQWVTQRLFDGKSWRDDPARAPAMFEAYRRFQQLHQLLAGLQLLAARTTGYERNQIDALAAIVEVAHALETSVPGSVILPTLRQAIRSRASERLLRHL